MKETYTPGPWGFDEDFDIWAGTAHIATVRHPQDSPCISSEDDDYLSAAAECEANAYILTAAPELYEALEMVRDADEDCKRDGLQTIPPAARMKIDRALAKAKPQPESGVSL